ncbi:MAG TPA: hypothetical protein VGQ39_21010, partial [Pyrinomonadaceae bacterium]|nr:hypothetical protein [Pyrinomonadaceae bacterium]
GFAPLLRPFLLTTDPTRALISTPLVAQTNSLRVSQFDELRLVKTCTHFRTHFGCDFERIAELSR